MERFTISLEESLAEQFDKLVTQSGYQNRSEAVRDLLRQKLTEVHLQTDQAEYCVACLSYVYNHHRRDLAERLIQLQHQYHDVVVVTTHVHLDHDNCLETILLRGATMDVQRFGGAIMTERGVRHGQLNIVPASVEEEKNADNHADAHTHSHPQHIGHVHVKPAN